MGNCFSAEESDPEINSQTSLPKIQPRGKAQWDDDLRMAEVVEKKGKNWVTTGIVKGSKTLCSIEETLFLVQIGGLDVTDPHGVCISEQQLCAKITDEQNGSSYELFAVYKHLKNLGYIVGRHGVPWRLKSVKNRSLELEDASADLNTKEIESKDVKSIDELTPAFDVYLPNSKFRKSSPGDPDFVIIFIRGDPPSTEKIGVVEKQFDGTPLKFCYVEHGCVNFLSFESENLPVL